MIQTWRGGASAATSSASVRGAVDALVGRAPSIGAGVDVVADALVAAALQPAHHVGAHPSEADHPELHAATAWHVACGRGRRWTPRRLDRDLAGAAAVAPAACWRCSTMPGAGTLDGRRRRAGCPGWTVGHVLTHLARNADSIVAGAAAAERGEVVDRYEGGGAGRDAEIEAGCGRPAAEQVADVRRTI